jgi:hypothetical protein
MGEDHPRSDELSDDHSGMSVMAALQALVPHPGPEAPRPARGSPYPPGMRAVQITRFGGPEVLDVVDVPDPTPGDGQQLYDDSTAGVNYADTHQALS